jgi:predicted Zn-dependent peptidase
MRFQRKKTEQYHVCLGAPGIARSDRRRFAASVLDALLGGSASSRLFQEIREKRGMAYAVYTFASQYTDTGLIGFYVGTRAENLADCLEIAS